jgi:mono/diheme cytochrome c family protein
MCRTLLAHMLLAAAVCQAVRADTARYHVGRPATAEDIRAAGISVAADGSGLPAGSGTALQGRPLYNANCAACHGSHGEGTDSYPALVGGRGTLKSDQPKLTVGSYWPYATTIWDYVNRAMPYQKPGSLSATEVYSLTAYILFMNKIIGESDVLDQKTLRKVRMPNRDGFVSDPRPDVP